MSKKFWSCSKSLRPALNSFGPLEGYFITNFDKVQLISEYFGRLHLNQKANENITVFLPYHSKIDEIKKRMQIIILEDK